jgi:hypothetical protein
LLTDDLQVADSLRVVVDAMRLQSGKKDEKPEKARKTCVLEYPCFEKLDEMGFGIPKNTVSQKLDLDKIFFSESTGRSCLLVNAFSILSTTN